MRTMIRRFGWLGLLAGAATLVAPLGCGRADDPSGSATRQVGATAGAPAAARMVNSGILQDQAAYTPAKADGSPTGGDGDGTPAAAGGADDGAARELVRNTLNATRNLNVDGLLAAFDEQQIAAITPHKSLMIEVIDKVEGLFRMLSEKSGTDSAGELRLLNDRFGQRFADAVADAVVVQPLAPDVAALNLDPVKLHEGLAAMMPEVVEVLTQMSASQPGAAEQIAATFTPENLQAGLATMPPMMLPVKRMGDAWKIALPRAITEEEADLVRQGLELSKEFLDKFGQKLEAAPQVDQNSAQMAAMMTFGEMAGQFMELQMKFQELMESGTEEMPEVPSEIPENPDEVADVPVDDSGRGRPMRRAPGEP